MKLEISICSFLEVPTPIRLWRMEFKCMTAISDLHVIDKSWGQHKADLGIIKYVAIAQHFEDKCVLYPAFLEIFLPQAS